jgi:hypothetical protein
MTGAPAEHQSERHPGVAPQKDSRWPATQDLRTRRSWHLGQGATCAQAMHAGATRHGDLQAAAAAASCAQPHALATGMRQAAHLRSSA